MAKIITELYREGRKQKNHEAKTRKNKICGGGANGIKYFRSMKTKCTDCSKSSLAGIFDFKKQRFFYESSIFTVATKVLQF